MVFQIFWIVLIVFIWFNTTALVDYSKLLKLDGVLKIKDWNVYKLTSNISYLDYLSLKHKGFITKLLSCKPCFMFWIALIISFIFRTPIEQFGMIYILSYSLYKLFDKYVW